MRHLPRTIALTAWLAGLATRPSPAAESPPTAEQVQFFESRIRPTLVNHCIKCHGPEKPKAGLRLDSRAAVLTGGDSGPALIPGNPSESLLIAAINHGEDGPKMPPSKKLPPKLIADLTQWVTAGAPWPGSATGAAPAPRRAEYRITEKDRGHWAFQPLRTPPVPAVRNLSAVANPIDAFLLSRLEADGLRPNPPATRLELLRRVTYDLTGLPPTPQEVDAFLEDSAPDAYDNLVDRLLDSPRYGEKWGRHWLDLVRYAETNSYERDNPKPNAWRYRDYVIRSFNQDKPYDRFVREQLAGDELPGTDPALNPDPLIATGYYRLGIWDDEPTDREQARYDGLDDIVATTGQVFLGLTIDCARCHDHKLDPIPQKDYYRFLSFFQNVNHFRNGGPTDEVAIYDGQAGKAAAEARARDEQARLDAIRGEIKALEASFLEKFARAKKGGARTPDLEDLRYRYYRDTWDRLPEFDGLKPEDQGKAPRPVFDLGLRTRDDAFGLVFEGTLIVPKDGAYTFHLDSDDGSRLLVGGRRVVEHDGIHGLGSEKEAKVDLREGRVPIRLEYFQQAHGLGLVVAWSGPGFDRRPLSAVGPRGEVPDKGEQPELARLLRSDGEEVVGKADLARYRALRRQLRQRETAPRPGSALCVTEAGTTAPATHVLMRGNPHVKGDQVEPGFLQVIDPATPDLPAPPPGARTSGRRLVLADWIASPRNPLTPRVLANRIWQYHFGRGIVRSPSNLGLQGDRPTHPELLDWLASELLRQGWRLKPLHRLIVTSNAYRMSSKANPEAFGRDPSNDHFWRFDMRRLGAEEIRDSILAVSGAINFAMYGPGVYPEIPAEVMAGQSIPGNGWGRSTPAEQARRSVYIHVKRSLLTPILESFDVAETDRSTPARFSTTQPTQALAMLNGAFLNEQSRVLAARLRREAGDDVRAQVARALRLATSRTPTEAEVDRGVGLVETLRSRDGLAPDAALESFCLVVLNLNEFLYLD